MQRRKIEKIEKENNVTGAILKKKLVESEHDRKRKEKSREHGGF